MYLYQDQDGTHEITEQEILRMYYTWWSEQMKQAGKENDISRENCIADFVVVHWAWKQEESMAQSRHEQLTNFIPSYRAGYVSMGGKDEDLRNDEDIVKKMEEANVQNESEAEKKGREDGFQWRQTH